MKRFIVLGLFFFLLLLILTISADIFISWNLKKSNQSHLKTWNDTFLGNVNSDIVIYGSSRAWKHINPVQFIDSFGMSTYNVGGSAYNFPLQYLRHLILIKNNKRPKFIIQSLDYLTLFKREKLTESNQYLPYMLNSKEMKDILSQYQGFSYWDYRIPMLRYVGKGDQVIYALKLFIAPDSGDRTFGYQGMNLKWHTEPHYQNSLLPTSGKLDSDCVELFDKYLQDCKLLGIKVIMVYTPEHLVSTTTIKDKERILKIYRSFSEKYHIPFYDYSKDNMCREERYFYHATHLNQDGAEYFTSKLIHDLIMNRDIN